MMRVCFDANVIIDIAAKRSNFFFDSFCAYDVAALRKFEVYIPVMVSGTLYYVLHRILHDKAKALEVMQDINNMFELFDEQPGDCVNALASAMPDFEDALLAYAAQRNGMDLIITRNVNDFQCSPVAAATPKQFVEMYKPESVIYDEMDL
jgi:predicted nucleic acid-binding protein